MNNNLFGNLDFNKSVHINIYADEIQNKECCETKDEWHYIGIIIEVVNIHY